MVRGAALVCYTSSRMLRHSVIAIPFLAAAIMVYGWPIAPDHDLYHHLQMGELLWKTKTWIFHDLFTYTAVGKQDDSWLFWLSQIIFYRIHAAFGVTGLRILNVLLLWTTLFFVARFLWKRTKNVGLTTAGTCLALVIHHQIQIIRPLLFGEALFSGIVFGWLARGEKLKPREIAVCALLACLWANLHATAVILIPLFVLHAVMQRQPAALLVPFATLLNPRGPLLYRAVWEANEAAKLTGNWEFASASPLHWISRLALPPLLQVRLDAVSLTLMILIPLVIWQMARKRDAFLPFNLFCVGMALLSVRHALYLFFPVAYFLAAWGEKRRYAAYSPGLVLAGVSLLFVFKVHESGYVNLSTEKASNFIEAAQLKGNVFCEDGWGAYVTYRHYPDIKVASDLRTNLHRDFFKKVGDLKRLYGPNAWKFIVEGLPPETDMVMSIAWKQQAQKFLDVKTWVIVFENNHITLSMKRNSPNLARIQNYYRAQGVPFNPRRGFEADRVFEQAPKWYATHQETMEWGRWPEAGVLNRWKEKERHYYESRHLPPPLG